MKVAIITTEQYNEIVGKYYTIDILFNPIKDINNNWVISHEEVYGASIIQYPWINDLVLIDYEPIPTEPLI